MRAYVSLLIAPVFWSGVALAQILPGVPTAPEVAAIPATAAPPADAIPLPQVVVEKPPAYRPITTLQRFTWFGSSTFGPASLLGGTVSAGWGTLFNLPHEYGTHWDGYGERYGMRMTGIATGNAMEAGLGAIWGEDPRYFRDGGSAPLKNRVGHIVKWTFVARDRNGDVIPAYARYLAVTGNNFLSNTWREPSEADNGHSLERIGLGVLGRMASNAWQEFWPDAKQKFFHRAKSNQVKDNQ